MIALLGSTEDDILYIKSKLTNVKKVHLVNNEFVYIGIYANVATVLGVVGTNNVTSAALTSAIIIKFDPYLIFSIGSIVALSPLLKQGDVCVADMIYYSTAKRSSYSSDIFEERKHISETFSLYSAINKQLDKVNVSYTKDYFVYGALISDDISFNDSKNIHKMINEYYPNQKHILGYNNFIAGIAATCQLMDVDLVSINAVSHHIENEDELITSTRYVLSSMPYIADLISGALILLS